MNVGSLQIEPWQRGEQLDGRYASLLKEWWTLVPLLKYAADEKRYAEIEGQLDLIHFEMTTIQDELERGECPAPND